MFYRLKKGNIMHLEFLGGTQEVGRSCTKIRSDDFTILLDCGFKHGEKVSYPEFDEADLIDGVVLTHAHLDHSGALPILASKELLTKNAKIFCAPPTAALLHILLWDSYKLQRTAWESRNERHLYEHSDVNEILNRLYTVPFQSFTPVEGIEAEFGYSGHILGSAWVRIKAGGRSFLFTGDLAEGRSLHLRRASFPRPSDILVTESTYGSTKQHPSFSNVCKNVAELLKYDGPILIPVFSIGRSIEILQLLRRYDIDGDQVWYDGMISDVLPIYRGYASDSYMKSSLTNQIKHSGLPKPFLPDGARTPRSMFERSRIIRDEENPIVVTPSGMLTGGWSPFYLEQMVEYRSQARVILVGFQAEGTLGRKLIDAKERGESSVAVDIKTFSYPVENSSSDLEEFGFINKRVEIPLEWIEYKRGFSAHSSASHLLEFSRRVSPRRIFVVHGDSSNSKALVNFFADDSSLKYAKSEIPKIGDQFEVNESIPASFRERLEKLEKKVSNLEKRLD